MGSYYVQGKNKSVSLGQNEFLGEGGEGKLYVIGNTTYKIYSDLNKMDPVSKLQELMDLSSHPNIICPKDLILEKKNNKVVGFTMDYVDGVSLCKLFTNDFLNRNNISPMMTTRLVENIIEEIVFIHDKNFLQVDGNETNYLVDNKTFTTPKLIDVNSYQTPSFPATFLMPSIRDWHTNGFNKLSDWFSFAIISFQLFVGIHPFKGKHPNFKSNQMEDRMKQNISVLNKDVKVPSACRDFSYIPTEFRDWYFKLFEKGERLPPPKVAGLLNISPVKVTVVQNTNNFEIQFLSEYEGTIVRHFNYFQESCTITTKHIIIGKTEVSPNIDKISVIFSTTDQSYILFKIKSGKLIYFLSKTREVIETNINCSEMMVIENTLYVRNGGNLIEISILEINNKTIVTPKTPVWNIMPHSSHVLGGFIFQSVLGKPYIIIPKPAGISNKNSSCQIIQIPELEGFRVLEGKHDNGICMIIGQKGNKYYRFIFKICENKAYLFMKDEDCSQINFVTLDNGVTVMIDDDDTVKVFHNNIKQTSMKEIKDPMINSSMSLFKNGIKVRISSKNKLYQLSMKK